MALSDTITTTQLLIAGEERRAANAFESVRPPRRLGDGPRRGGDPRDEDEAVARANDTWSGLWSSVWSGDDRYATSVAESLRTGVTFFNNHKRHRRRRSSTVSAASTRAAWAGSSDTRPCSSSTVTHVMNIRI